MAIRTAPKQNRRLLANEAEPVSLAQRAYSQIREEILRGRFAIGDVLSRRALADKLNMSFLPITEALQRLEVEGLVESRPRSGTRVRVPTRQDVFDSYVLREALETQAARLCAEHSTPEEREQLLKSAKHLDDLYRVSASEVAESAFLFSVHTYHMKFHTRIAELSRSPKLLQAIEHQQVLIYNWLYDTAAHRTKLPEKFHLNLATSICSGDLQVADARMREHIRFGLEDVVDSITNLEGEKGWRLKR